MRDIGDTRILTDGESAGFMYLTNSGGQISLSRIFDGNPVATIVIDSEHRVIHWNRACAVMTGVPASEMIGSRDQWRAFYPDPRPILADLIVDGAVESKVDTFYHGKFHRSELIESAYEAEDFFPAFGDHGCWLFFTAAPICDDQGRVIGAIETLQNVTERHRAEEALRASEERYRELSRTDALTGLLNTRTLWEHLLHEIARAKRYGRPLSLMVLDCDDFKAINDRFGHLEGDRVLIELAALIRACERGSDSAYRYGGEEFVILLPETAATSAMQLAERVRARFAGIRLPLADAEAISATISIGVAEWRPGEDEQTLIRRADEAVYAAKHRGKNCVVLAE